MFKHVFLQFSSWSIKKLHANIFVIHPAVDSSNGLKKIRNRLVDFPYLSEKVWFSDIF